MSDFLEVYPIWACEYQEQNGLITVTYKNQRPTFIEKIFFKKLAEKELKIDLDEIGSFVWKLCDGNNSVSEIINKSKQNFGEKVEPTQDRVELFIKQLKKNGLIQLYVKK